jgi:hypothetical protein
MASNITVDTLTKGSTTLNTDEIVDTNSSQVCKAWVNFNGTGTPSIRDSYNVSSITDAAPGDYRVNFTNSLANVNYSPIVTASTSNDGAYASARLVNKFSIIIYDGGYVDRADIMAHVFGD